MKKYALIISLCFLWSLGYAQTKPATTPASQQPKAPQKKVLATSESMTTEHDPSKNHPSMDTWGNKALRHASTSFYQGLTSQALDTVNKIIEKFPKAYGPIQLKGFIYSQLASRDSLSQDSVRMFSQIAIDLLSVSASQNEDKPVKVSSLEGLVSIYSVLRNDDSQTFKYLNELISADPKNPEHYIKRSSFYIKLGRNDEACEDIHKAKSLGMTDPAVIDNRLLELRCPVKVVPGSDGLPVQER